MTPPPVEKGYPSKKDMKMKKHHDVILSWEKKKKSLENICTFEFKKKKIGEQHIFFSIILK